MFGRESLSFLVYQVNGPTTRMPTARSPKSSQRAATEGDASAMWSENINFIETRRFMMFLRGKEYIFMIAQDDRKKEIYQTFRENPRKKQTPSKTFEYSAHIKTGEIYFKGLYFIVIPSGT